MEKGGSVGIVSWFFFAPICGCLDMVCVSTRFSITVESVLYEQELIVLFEGRWMR